MIADDNAAIRKMVAAAFLADGFEKCGEAENGKEAIEIAKRIKPDIIILDLSMPVMNGLAAASELRKIFPDIPIILSTLHAKELRRSETAKAGITSVLSKTQSLPRLIGEARALMLK